MSPTPFKVVTINILNDMSRWGERRELLLRDLRAQDADLIALQEVRLPENSAAWLADRLNQAQNPGDGEDHSDPVPAPYSVYLCPKSGDDTQREAIAILSRLPVEAHETLDLHTQNRVAQYVQVQVDDHPLVIANGHFYWQPGESPARLRQIELLLAWLQDLPENLPIVVCGDFNSTPKTAPIQTMRLDFASAYASLHGDEPEYSAPSPLVRSTWSIFRSLLSFIRNVRVREIDLHWHGTIDYIFINSAIRALESQVVLNRPAPGNPKIYPSDHFGLSATLEIKT